MANIKISELTALTPPDAADLVPVTDSSASQTKRTTVGEIVGIINGDVDVADDGTATISELPVSKLQDGAPRQLLQTDAAGTGVEWTSNVDIPGTLDVTGAATLDSTLGVTGQSTLASAAVSDLTSGRVVLAGTSGELEDNAGLTFNGTQLDVDGDVDIASAKEYRIAGTKVLDATSLGSAVISSSLTSVGTISSGIWQGTPIEDTYLDTISTAGKVSNSATTATSANTASAIVARDGSGDFSAGTITAALTGNASTATALSSTRTFEVTGDITGTVSSDLTSGASIATSIASGVIVDDDVNASAAIAGTKIDPDFGSQTIETTGGLSVAGKISGTAGASISGTGWSPPSQVANSLVIDSTAGQTRLFATGTDASTHGNLLFFTGTTNGTASERMRMTSSGLGIGTSAPAAKLHLNSATSTSFQIDGGVGNSKNIIFATAGVEGAKITGDIADDLRFSTAGAPRLTIDSSGNVLVGTASDSGGALLQVNGDRVRIATAKTPASAGDTGTTGEVCWDADYIYVCTATNTWKRAALSTW